ncbi:outer membrane transport energization protein ExbD [Fontimonas thermophila]|uniref:Outer membrane transport energization protein ExbD n=1 Tax=Fontimonas thermophila TaxID=1076937 RepID=A0A1I2K9C6_9GAMM|nr:biopolymer transporter ExbD [Fontimonas thermophila]SFF63685.1 outer membrane transport energization protein ExbD [Fontimonas thermophila]
MKLSYPRRLTTGMSMLPVLNVILLLLAFFVMLAQVGAPDRAGVLARSSAATVADSSAMLLEMDARGAVYADGVAIEDARLADWRLRSGATRLRLRADARAPAARVLAVLADLQAGGADRVQLLVVRR